MAIKFLSGLDLEVTSSILKTNASGVIVAAVAGTDYAVASHTHSYLPLAGGTITGNIVLNDNVQLQFGATADLRIYSNGTDNYINNINGNLNIRNNADDKDINFQNDDGTGNYSTYFYLDGSLTNGTSILGATRFPDSSKIFMGTSGDMELFHSGTTATVSNATGDLQFINYADDSKIRFYNDDGIGGIIEYIRIDGSTLETVFSKDARWTDNVKAKFGNSSDLQIYHDAAHSHIINTTGDLTIDSQGDDLILKAADDALLYVQGTDIAIQAIGDGKVGLRYNNVEKLATTSTGVTVTGVVTATGGTSTQWNTAYTYSQVGHLPLAGGTITKSSTHTTGNISTSNAHLDLYNSLQANTDQKGSIITFTDNYYDGSNYQKTTRAAIKGGTDTIGNTADGYLEFYTDSGGANSPTLALRLDRNQNATFAGTVSASNLSGTNTGDQDLSTYALTSTLSGYLTNNANDTLRKDQNADTSLTIRNNTSGTAGSASLDLRTNGNNFDITNYSDLFTGKLNVTEFKSSAGSSSFQFSPASTTVMTITGTAVTIVGDVSATNLSGTNTGDQNLSTYAPLASPTFTGTPRSVTPAANTNTTQIATTAYVQTELTDLIGGAPGTLDTLNELAAAINDDDDYASTLTSALATKLPLAGGTLTGDLSTTTITSAAAVGDKVSLYDDRLGLTSMYGFGIESSTLYYKSGTIHRWYVGANADAGVSDTMELVSTGLTVNGTITATGGNSTEWNTAYDKTLQWNGGATGLVAATGRASLGLGSAATSASTAFVSSTGNDVITHATGQTGLGIYNSAGAIPTVPQLKVGRDSSQYWGVMTQDHTATLIHRQDETGTETPNTKFEIWASSTGTAYWQWNKAANTGASASEKMKLTDGGSLTLGGGSNTITNTKVGQWNTAYGWGDHGLSAQDKTDIGNLSGTNTGDQTLPTASSLGAVTLTGTQTITGTKTLSNSGNIYNGHHYYSAYDAAGNHYPHFQDGSSAGGTTVNWRQYYGSTFKTHTWTSDGSGNMAFVFQGSIDANGGNITGNNLSGTNTGDQTTVSGNAGTVTNGVYTTGTQTITGTKTINTLIIGTSAKIQFQNNDFIRYDDVANRWHFDVDGGSSNGSLQAGTFVGALTGNASSASVLQAPVDIAGVSFDGSIDIDLDNSNIQNGAGYTTYTANQALNTSSSPTFTGVTTLAAPAAPTSLVTSVVNDTINVTFTASTTSGISNYLVFSSVAGGDYGLISVIPPADFAATMSVIDNSFDTPGTQAYRVYAVKNGVYSSPLTGSKAFSAGTVEVTGMSAVNLNKAFYVQWDSPSSNARFVVAYNVYKHEHATAASLAEGSATLVYSGMNTNFMYSVSGADNDNFHKFWITTTIAS